MMRQARRAAMICCLFLTMPAPLCARPETDVLEVVPDSALGVFVVNRLRETSDRLAKLGRELQVEIPAPLAFAKALAGVGYGVDERGSLAIAFFTTDEGLPPAAALFIPVDDYEKFLEPLEPSDPKAAIAHVTFFRRQALVARKAGFAVLVGPAHEELLTTIRSSTAGVDQLIKPLAKWISSQSLAAVTLKSGTTRTVQALDAWLARIEKKPDPEKELPQPAPGILSDLRYVLRQLETELAQCALGLELADSGPVTINF
ncbi:MAG TPA: hypothetical protein VHY20_11460, partial [Pirellulales bacterium]|nr:hypothetical protein [Pirellulales bacterium]